MRGERRPPTRNKHRLAEADSKAWTGDYYVAPSYWTSPGDVSTEVCAAVESLYCDELKPYGRILRKRLAERAQVFPSQLVDVDVQHLRTICETCPWLYVSQEEGGDWSAWLYGQPPTFVDVYSPQDVYPPEMWEAAAEYFGSLEGAAMVLPGGRYSCAQVLLGRQVPFLMGRSLGQVCHIVQLAISQKKLLGYLNGAVVPYRHSQSMVKEKCAEVGKPLASSGTGSARPATWDTLRSSLKELIDALPSDGDCVPLSNMKRIFRSRFNLELSETSLGYPKLSELLQDPRLADICSVGQQGRGYVVVPLRKSATGRSAISISDSLPRAFADEDGQPQQGRRGRPLELCLDEDVPSAPSTTAGTLSGVESHPAAVCAYPATPSPGNSARARSLPKLLGSGRNRLLPRDTWFSDKDGVKSWTSPAEQPLAEASAVMPTESWAGFKPLTPSTLDSLGLLIQNTFIHANLPPPTPVSSVRAAAGRAHSLPRNMGSGQANLLLSSTPR